MAGFIQHYNRSKSTLRPLTAVHLEEVGKDLAIAGIGGAGVALIGAVNKSLDRTVAGVKVPLDAAWAVGLGLLGKSMGSPELRIASIAAGGAAASRILAPVFNKNLAAHGEMDEGTAGMGWGADSEYGADPLVESAKYL